MNTSTTNSIVTSKPKHKINWKMQNKREAFFLKHGRFPSNRELKRGSRKKPILMFGYGTV